jgi:hypothetical protein
LKETSEDLAQKFRAKRKNVAEGFAEGWLDFSTGGWPVSTDSALHERQNSQPKAACRKTVNLIPT